MVDYFTLQTIKQIFFYPLNFLKPVKPPCVCQWAACSKLSTVFQLVIKIKILHCEDQDQDQDFITSARKASCHEAPYQITTGTHYTQSSALIDTLARTNQDGTGHES